MQATKLDRLVDQLRGNPYGKGWPTGRLRKLMRKVASHGPAGIAAVVAGLNRPGPPDQDPRDVFDALSAILHEMARCDPQSLVDAYHHGGKMPRWMIVFALQSAKKADTVIDVLLKAQGDSDSNVRWAAVEGLIALRHPRSKPAIFKSIADRAQMVRFAIVHAVNTIDFFREPAAIAALRRLLTHKRLKERHPGTWEHASQALARLEREVSNQPVREANYSWSDIKDSDLAMLKSLSTLRSLDLSDTRISDRALRHIRQLTQLRSLNINNTRITPDGLKQLYGLKRLKSLSVGGVTLTLSRGRLRVLAPLTSLIELDLGGTSVRDEDLKELAPLVRLRSLSLFYRVSDKGLANLLPLKRLESLRLYDCPLTDHGLGVLRRFRRLKVLRLEHAPIGDAGLQQLEAISGLQRLDVRGTNVTPQAIKRFRRARPSCTIEA